MDAPPALGLGGWGLCQEGARGAAVVRRWHRATQDAWAPTARWEARLLSRRRPRGPRSASSLVFVVPGAGGGSPPQGSGQGRARDSRVPGHTCSRCRTRGHWARRLLWRTARACPHCPGRSAGPSARRLDFVTSGARGPPCSTDEGVPELRAGQGAFGPSPHPEPRLPTQPPAPASSSVEARPARGQAGRA